MVKGQWRRGTAFLALDGRALAALAQPAFPGRSVEHATPVDGGLSNTNYRVVLSGQPRPVLLRLFVRMPASSRLEAALPSRLGGRVPLPGCLYYAESNPITGHPYAFFEWVDGVVLDTLPGAAGPAELAALGGALGAVLAAIGSFTFPAAGFLDPALRVVRPMSLDGAIFRSYIHNDLFRGRGAERLGADLTRRLWEFVTAESPRLDGLEGPPCLAHGDFDGSNILVRQTAGRWQISGVVDWEYALSATPLLDLAHILRPPFGDIEPFERNLLDAFVAHGGTLPPGWKPICGLLDLLNWVSYLNRPLSGDEVLSSSRQMILRTMDRWPS